MRRFHFIFFPLLILLFLSGCAKSPQHCFLCGSPPYEAPCVVDLATGRIGEISVGDNQGARSIQFVGNAVITIDPWFTHADVPDVAQNIDVKLFCEDCLAIISEVPNRGYVIADLSDTTNISLFPAQTENAYAIQDYNITITDVADTFRIEVSKIP